MNLSPELVIYKASAGSGKTFTLATEYIKLLIVNPRAYRNILAVTFTNKATAEMKERILTQLYGISINDTNSTPYIQNITKSLHLTQSDIMAAAGKALNYILHDYSYFRIETIDSFFQSVMRNLARELRLGTNMNLEIDNVGVLNDAVDAMIEKLTRNSPVLVWLLEYINEKIENDHRWNISDEIKQFGLNIFNEEYLEKGSRLRTKLKQEVYLRNYRAKLKSIREDILKQMKELAEQFQQTMEKNGINSSDIKYGKTIIGYFLKISNGIINEKVRNVTIEKFLSDAEEWLPKTSKSKDTFRPVVKNKLLPLLQKCEKIRHSNNILLNSCDLSLHYLNNLQLLASIDEEVKTQNRDNNRFLLSDTNALLHDLVQDDDPSFVFEKVGINIQHVMIDEFQDTSRMQWNNFKLLLLEGLSQGSNSLIVGDVKQSIYRWRNGDWRILNGLKDSIGAFPIKIKTLTTNHRSENNVICFNNRLFKEACRFLNETYKEKENKDCEELLSAYADVCQLSTQKEDKGYVRMEFLDSDKDKTYEERMLNSIGIEIQRLVESGVYPSDIAILVRKNKVIPLIADYFKQNMPYRVVSDNAFRMDASPAICMVINALRYLSDPTNRIAATQLAMAYQNDVLHHALSIGNLPAHHLEKYLPEEFISQLGNLRIMPLYELVESLFSLFNIGQIENQEAYLFAFNDAVLEYLQNNPSDISLFLVYWDEKLREQTIPSEEIEGIRIMSIHDSKGLEFHTVIVPFCDWKLENENTQLIWCTPNTSPFNELDLIPINYSSKMDESVYKSNYQEEKTQLWVDNLNILYVAFTRAEKNLLVFGKSNRKNTVSDLLIQSIHSIQTQDGKEWDEEMVFEYGNRVPSSHSVEKRNYNKLTIPPAKKKIHMETFNHNIEFKQSNRSAQFIRGKEDVDVSEKYISQGQLLHAFFSNIQTQNDINASAAKLLLEGVISSQDEKKRLQEFAIKVLSLPIVSQWYSGEYDLLTERDIIFRKGERTTVRRPDRVMVKGDRAIIVDLKFGKKKPEYAMQVQEYMKLLSQMNKYKEIKGYLWYVYENEIEEVL